MSPQPPDPGSSPTPPPPVSAPSGEAAPTGSRPPDPKTWPMSWVVIAILAYLLLQTAYIAFWPH